MFDAALLDDFDRVIRSHLEVMNALDQTLQESFDNVRMLFCEAQARGHSCELNHRQRFNIDHLESCGLGEQASGWSEQRSIDYPVAHPLPKRRRLVLLRGINSIHGIFAKLGLIDE